MSALVSRRIRLSTRSALFALTGILGLALAAACSDPPSEDPTAGSTGGSGNTGNSSSGGSGNTGNESSTGGTTEGGAPTQDEPPYGHPDPEATYPEHEGFELWLVEEFEEPIDLDNDPIWTWSDGFIRDGSNRFVKEAIGFDDGKLKITISETDPEIPLEVCSYAEVREVTAKPLQSGELRTKFNMFRYGRYEVRMKAPFVNPDNPEATGNYISTMFVFRNPKFQNWRELDIEVTGDAAASLTTNLLYAEDVEEWRASIAEDDSQDPGLDPREEFHNYAFEWLPDRVTWYVDDVVVREKTIDDGLPIPELSAKIMMNLWVFGPSAGFGGRGIADNVYPFANEYEWFRFYKWNDDADYPCKAMDASCLEPGDEDLAKNNPCDGIAQTGEYDRMCEAACNY